MNSKEALKIAVEGFDWLRKHPEAWKWKNEHRVLLTDNVPDYVKYVIEKGNKGIDRAKRVDALQNKLEGNN